MPMKANNKRINANELIYPELSYKLMGVLFRVHRQLGNRYQEKYYQRAVEADLGREKIAYEREFEVKLYLL